MTHSFGNTPSDMACVQCEVSGVMDEGNRHQGFADEDWGLSIKLRQHG